MIRSTVVKMHFDNCRNALLQLSKSISTYVKRFVCLSENSKVSYEIINIQDVIDFY